MRRLLLFLCLPFLISADPIPPLPAERAPLIVQPFYMKDIYRNQIWNSVPFHVTVITFRNFDNDRWRESKPYAIKRVYEHQLSRGKRQVIMLGEIQERMEGRYLSIFRDSICACYLFDGKVIADTQLPVLRAIELLGTDRVYVITDKSDLAKRREATLRRTLIESNVKLMTYNVSSATELRAALVSLNSKPQGILFIDAYDLLSDTGKRIRYRYIEQVVTDFNKTHLEVGIYRREHRSALAVGLDPADIGKSIVSLIEGTPQPALEVKSSVNVARLNQLGLLHLAAGSFKEAFLYEPIDSR